MRILLFLPTLAGGGAERSMLTVAERLHEAGHGVELVTALAGGDLGVPAGIRSTTLGVAHSRAAVPRLAWRLRTSRPDVLVTAMDHGNAAAVVATKLSRTGVPVVVSYRMNLSAAAAAGRGRQRLRPLAARIVMRGADEVVAVSHGVADDLRAHAPWVHDRLTVVHNPSVSDRLAVLAEEPLDDEWFRDHLGPTVVAAGRLVPQKGYHDLIAAIAQVRLRTPDVRLVILGEGPSRPDIEAGVRHLGLTESVRLRGFVHNPYPYFKRCDAFVLSSHREGLGNVLVEAAALGAPVVATDCPSGPRELLAGRPNAELVPVGDTTALAEAMVAAMRRDRTPHPGEVWSDHSVEASVHGWTTVLQRAADGAAPDHRPTASRT